MSRFVSVRIDLDELVVGIRESVAQTFALRGLPTDTVEARSIIREIGNNVAQVVISVGEEIEDVAAEFSSAAVAG